MTAPVNIAVYGPTGLIGRRHLQHILENPETQVVALVDPSPAAAEAATQTGAPLYATSADLLRDVAAKKLSLDMGFVCTPTHLHVPQALELIEHGVHVFVEKPFAVDSESGKRVIQAAQEAKVKLVVGHHRRHNPHLKMLKKQVDSGKLGQIVGFKGIWALKKPLSYFADPWRRQADSGGVILTNLIHELDLLGYLFGPITRVYCESGVNTRGFEVDETVAMTLKFASGMVGTFLMSDVTPSPFSWESATGENPNIPSEDEICYTVLGTKGSTTLPKLLRFHYDHVSEQDAHWNTVIGRDPIDRFYVEKKLPLVSQLENVVKVVRDEAEPVCSGQDGLRAVAVIEAIQASIKTSQPVSIPNQA